MKNDELRALCIQLRTDHLDHKIVALPSDVCIAINGCLALLDDAHILESRIKEYRDIKEHYKTALQSFNNAKSRIQELESQLAATREALKPFADLEDEWGSSGRPPPILEIRRAKAVMEGKD